MAGVRIPPRENFDMTWFTGSATAPDPAGQTCLLDLVAAMRADHPVTHERYVMWQSMADLLDCIALAGTRQEIDRRAKDVVVAYQAAKAVSP